MWLCICTDTQPKDFASTSDVQYRGKTKIKEKSGIVYTVDIDIRYIFMECYWNVFGFEFYVSIKVKPNRTIEIPTRRKENKTKQ